MLPHPTSGSPCYVHCEMVNYYDILKVSPKASSAEIKSAYRRLARKLHPDLNNGSGDTARKFASIAEAYEVLGNPKERASYDARLLKAQYNGNGNGDSVFSSDNPHARRWRQMVYEKRYNEIIDRMIAEERRESVRLQKAIYPTVALFMSTLIVAMVRPKIFDNSAMLGKMIVISLFVVGVIHLIGRIKEGYEHYTYNDSDIHDSILDENEPKTKPYSRLTATAFLGGGILVSFAVGFLIGNYLDFVAMSLPSMFSSTLRPEFFLYPPIIVLFVDLMHSFASRLD